MLKVWGRLSSVNVQKVVWCADELGIAYERIDAGGKFGLVNTTDYRRMNPNGLVPVIDDDGFVLWESNAIVRYLASRYGMNTLWPADERTRASADRWMDWQATSLNPAISPAFIQLIRTVEGKRDLAIVESARQLSEQKLALLDAHLATSTYVAGSEFSASDVVVGASVQRWYELPLARERHVHVERWHNTLKRRPGAAQVMSLRLE